MPTRKLRLKPEAEAEIVEAYNWYELQLEGLGGRFLDAVDLALSFIEAQPMAHPIVHQQIRRAVMRKFPYSILFVYEQSEENETITIISCFDSRRDPKRWRKREV